MLYATSSTSKFANVPKNGMNPVRLLLVR
uniref:Uncharacterized protein n=1 Tax=Arundo donax TaxID=35708 RepID=A0A0A8ZHJ9_ARUDO